jgi:hypothetical protein
MANTMATSTANAAHAADAATCKRVWCHGDTSKREGREQEDCFVQLELSHGISLLCLVDFDYAHA